MTTPSLTNPNPKREGIDHEFKSHPDVFWPAARGEKTFEFRKDDRGGYQVGQTVRLRCFANGSYTADAPIDRVITNILRPGEFGLQDGYCILSLASSRPSPGDPVRAALEEAQNALGIIERTIAKQGYADEHAIWDAVEVVRAALSVSTPTGEGEAIKQAWRPMKDAPTGFPIVAKHKPNSAMPHGWIATILLGHGDEDEPGSLDTILHYNGTSIYGVFHGCWDGWMHCEDAATLAHPQQGGDERGWQLMPLNPTVEMEEAACCAADNGKFSGQYLRNIYRALLDAAPTSASKSSGDVL